MPNPAISPISRHTLASAWHKRQTVSRIKSQMLSYPAVIARSYKAAIVFSSFVSSLYGLQVRMTLAFCSQGLQLAFANVVAGSYLMHILLHSQARTASPLILNMQLASWLIDVFGIGITNLVDTISIVGGRHQYHGHNFPPANENIIFLNRSWMGRRNV